MKEMQELIEAAEAVLRDKDRSLAPFVRLRNAAAAARAYEGGWIDCQVRLPEPGVNVLAIIHGYSHDSQHYTVYRTEELGDSGYWSWRDSHFGNQSFWFTHWMALPSPPLSVPEVTK